MTSLVVCSLFQFVDCFCFCVDKEKVYVEEFLKLLPSHDGEDSGVQLLPEEALRPLGSLTTSKEGQHSKNLILIPSELVY